MVSFGTILINIVQYGMGEVGPWLSKAMFVLFWLNAVLAIFLSIAIYLILFESVLLTLFALANGFSAGRRSTSLWGT